MFGNQYGWVGYLKIYEKLFSIFKDDEGSREHHMDLEYYWLNYIFHISPCYSEYCIKGCTDVVSTLSD